MTDDRNHDVTVRFVSGHGLIGSVLHMRSSLGPAGFMKVLIATDSEIAILENDAIKSEQKFWFEENVKRLQYLYKLWKEEKCTYFYKKRLFNTKKDFLELLDALAEQFQFGEIVIMSRRTEEGIWLDTDFNMNKPDLLNAIT